MFFFVFLIYLFFFTWADEVKQHGAPSVRQAAEGREDAVQDEEEGAGQEAGHPHRHTKVARVGVLVEHTQQTLAADVDVTLVDDAAEYHHGEHLPPFIKTKRSDSGSGHWWVCVSSFKS